MVFIEKLIQQIKDKQSVVCMGLDPRMDQEGQIPRYIIEENDNVNEIILEFNKVLIEKTCDLIPIIKPQIAFYEKYDALMALKETIKYAQKKDLLVVLDSKRNDIGSTSQAYADATFKTYKADAVTLNAYLGIDCIKPFLEYKEKGLFILVKTSNPSSRDFQDLFSARLDEIPDDTFEVERNAIKLERNYIQMARLIQKWGKNSSKYSEFHNLGAVVGATFPIQMKKIREILNNSFILIPGYGAQGANAKDIKYGFDDKGLGGIVNSSRGIMFAYKKMNYTEDKFGEAAREEVISMNNDINKELGI